MRIYIYIYMYRHIYTHALVCLLTYVHACIRSVYLSRYIDTQMHACMYIYVHDFDPKVGSLRGLMTSSLNTFLDEAFVLGHMAETMFCVI